MGGWDDSICTDMVAGIADELLNGVPIDHNTDVGLAMLYEKAGGLVSHQMIAKITAPINCHHQFNFHRMFLKVTEMVTMLKVHYSPIVF